MKGVKAVKDTVGIFGTRLIWSGMGVISGVILARWLGPYDRGILALVLLVPSTVLTLVKLGVSQATVYYINRKEASVDQVASNSVVLAFVLGTLSWGLVWVLRGNLLSSVLKDPSLKSWNTKFSTKGHVIFPITNSWFGGWPKAAKLWFSSPNGRMIKIEQAVGGPTS